MENSVRKTDVPVIPTKSKSLDIQSLYLEKSRVSKGRGERRALKRKRRSLVENREFSSGKGKNQNPGKKKKRSRKEVSLSSFEPASKGSVEGQNAIDSLKFNDINKNDSQVPGGANLKSTNSSNNISRNLDDVITIPKKPRGCSRRKKLQNNHISVDTGTSENVTSVAQVVKLTGESSIPLISSEGKKKKHHDDFKENSSSRANSARRLKTENGASLGLIGDSSKKRVRRRKRKDHESEQQDQNLMEHLEPSVDNSSQTSANLQDDDEENLEQNAARMLSSRFDPSCTGFSGNRTASTSMNDCSLTPSVSGIVANSQANHSAGSESNSADAAGRVLRPRKQHKEKDQMRRRRHFYELFFRDLDAYWVLNRRIKVFWPLDKSWYFGLVSDYDPERKLHHVKYDDRDEEWINLQNERFKLLLLPSEVPRKPGSENPGMGGKHVGEKGQMDGEEQHNCIGSFMDSEPIISWLARATRLVKSSPFGGIMKRRKTSVASKNYVSPMFSDDSIATTSSCLVAGPSENYADHLSGNTVALERSTVGSVGERSVMDHTTRSKDRNLPLVYFRRRFRKKGQELGCISQDSFGCRNGVGSVSSLATVVDVDNVLLLEDSDTALRCSLLDPDCVFWSGESSRLLRFTVPAIYLDKVRLTVRISLHLYKNVMLGGTDYSRFQLLLLLHHGVMVSLWPRVRLEMLFVDNVVGLRFMLFEGCLMQAVSLVCLVMTVFHSLNMYEKFVDLQFPITSIRLKFSGFSVLERQLVFVSYNYMELDNTKWQYLDDKLKQYCSVSKQIPLSECTFDNISVMQSRRNQLRVPSVSGMPTTAKDLQRKPKQGIMRMGFSKEFANINTGLSSSKSDEKHMRFPPFVLSFSAAPSFFVSLHLKLLMEKNVASVSFQNSHPMSLIEDSQNCGTLLTGDDDLSSFEKFADQVNPKVEIDALSISNGGNWMQSSKNCLNSEHNVNGTSIGCRDFGKSENSDDHSSPGKLGSGHFSHFNGISVRIPLDDQFGTQSLDRGRQNAQQSSSNLVWHVNDCNIRSPNPTAPRSIWHRNRHNSGSSSFSYRSKMWPDGRADFRNGLVTGSKKPRTQISYLLPFGGYDFSSKPRSHHRKGRPYKKIKSENEKLMSSSSRSPRRQPNVLSCDANVLITERDRGWRECGCQVVLELVDHKDWKLLVKVSGVTKYSHKPYQVLLAGSSNRHTHAMMWKGGKDWTLEFPDRSQWARFKEMHEDCYSRNIRAALVKSIPIPGVRLLEEKDVVAAGVPFVRTVKYHKQLETDVEMALNPSRFMYDMDSDDEEWLLRYQKSSDICENNMPEISVDIFERTMDMFERVAYAEERDDFTVDELDEIMTEIGPVDGIEAIHEHWRQKRQKRKWPLIRQLQPPLWERYQQQLREWEMTLSKLNNFPNGCKENSVPEKPAMFAFCLRPRGLEAPNKGSKQRSHRKFSAGGKNYTFSRDQDGFHFLGRKSNGFDDGGVLTGQDHDFSDVSPWLHTSTRVISPRDAVGTGYMSMSSDGSERNHRQNIYRSKAKKMRKFLAPTDSQMMAMSYNQRTAKRNGISQWNMGYSEWPNNRKQYYHQSDGFQKLRVEQLDDSDLDEFRLRDASGAAQHASNMAKLKREKAQRLLYRADLAIHKASVALMIAEAIKASSEKELVEDDG